MDKQQYASNAANEALDALECAHSYMRWLSGLGHAIDTDLKTGKGFVAQELASLVRYLADSHANDMSEQIATLNEQLEAAKLRV